VDKGKEGVSFSGMFFNNVVFQIHEAYKTNPPNCVAVLPFETALEDTDKTISVDQTEMVRRAFYAHLAPQGKRDIELPRVNFVLSKMSQVEQANLMMVGEQLNCGTVVQGKITEYGKTFYGLYSNVAVGANLKLVRAADGVILWEGSHVAQSHGGSVPLSPIGLAMSIYHASNNVREEQILRIIDDLARRLVSTIPDNQVAVQDEQLTEIKAPSKEIKYKLGSVEEFMASLNEKPAKEQKIALLEAINEERFGADNLTVFYEKLIVVSPDDPGSYSAFAQYKVTQGDYRAALQNAEKSLALDNMGHINYFLKGRILIKLGDLNGADQAIVKAASIDKNSSAYLNGLGYVNSLRGNNERALAAYRIAIQRDPSNGYAYYNTAVTLQNIGDSEEAADAYYGAGLAYFKTGDYGPATKALTDLKDLKKGGINRTEEIGVLENLLQSLAIGE
jgi:tetratricopeptide (TPR) repeat protein